MTDTLVLPRPSTFLLSSGFGFDLSSIKTYKGSKGTVYEKVPVFRTGTFRDSLGYSNTWEDLHVEQMVANGSYLKKNSIMDGWPVRDGHSTYLVGGVQGRGNTVGWTHAMETSKLKSPVDGQEYTYLLCDYEITEPYAQAKLDNGTWRNRSSEVGRYITNNEAELWPCFMGFAFVDIPAVEGLNFQSSDSGNRFFCVDFGGVKNNKEIPVAADETAGVLPVLPFSSPAAPAAQPAAPAASAPAAQATAFTFSCNGTRVSDPSVVQTYINQLETAMLEQRQVTRASFVKDLSDKNKIPATQIEEFTKHVMSLNDEQYSFWCKQMGGSEPLSLLSNHSVGASQTSAQHGSDTSNAQLSTQALRDADGIVKMHQRAGQTADFIKQTNSYKTLVAAGVTVQL